MRQFNYKYRSFMKNRHGFVNMVPDAKMLHPYIGFSGYHGLPTFQTMESPGYSKNFCELFMNKNWVFTHHVKIFFPEIRHGLLMVDKTKYSIKKSEEDDVSISTKVVLDGKYEEYTVIEDFIAEFKIEISVNFGKRGSITSPVEIFCDYIDVYVQNQRISLTIHDNNLLFIPYAMSYRTEFPPEVARLDSDSTNIVVNTDLTYGFVLNEAAKNKLKSKGFAVHNLDGTMLDTKKLMMGITNKESGNSEDYGLPIGTMIDSFKGVSKKYVVLLPESIFPDKMELTGLPIFDSEQNMKCCDYRKLGWCSPYFKIYDVDIPASCKPQDCDPYPICQDTPQYEVRNKIIDGYLILADEPWKVLDKLAGLFSENIKRQKLVNSNIAREGIRI